MQFKQIGNFSNKIEKITFLFTKKNYLNCSQHQNKSIVCKCLKWKKLFIETVETKKKSEIKKFEKLFPYFIMFQLQQYIEKISHQLVI